MNKSAFRLTVHVFGSCVRALAVILVSEGWKIGVENIKPRSQYNFGQCDKNTDPHQTEKKKN